MTIDFGELSEFAGRAEAWLRAHAAPLTDVSAASPEPASDRVALFHNLAPAEEAAMIEGYRRWHRTKSDAGFASIAWPTAYGGGGLTPAHQEVFDRLEAGFAIPRFHEGLGVSLNIVAPVLLAMGTEEQKTRYLRRLRRTDDVCCQLFSEPGAGSDLRAMTTRAVREDTGWRVNGQKVWTSGAQFADFGFLIARTGEAPSPFTAFIVDLKTPGVEVRPLRQITGGASFNEVFLTDVRIEDRDRIGDVGRGWEAMLLMLEHERSAVAALHEGSHAFGALVRLARTNGVADDPTVRQELAAVFIEDHVRRATRARSEAGAPVAHGTYASLGKLGYTQLLMRISEALSLLLGPGLAANVGGRDEFAWAEFVLGVPGMRIAGGTDEIQRNLIAERALGLPREPRPAKAE